MILRFLFYFFLFYLGYKLLFEFMIPVFRTTRQVKRGFRNMQDQVRQQAENGGQSAHAEPKKEKGDYIDFEEVK